MQTHKHTRTLIQRRDRHNEKRAFSQLTERKCKQNNFMIAVFIQFDSKLRHTNTHANEFESKLEEEEK